MELKIILDIISKWSIWPIDETWIEIYIEDLGVK